VVTPIYHLLVLLCVSDYWVMVDRDTDLRSGEQDPRAKLSVYASFSAIVESMHNNYMQTKRVFAQTRSLEGLRDDGR
jgi:hypothetical protein